MVYNFACDIFDTSDESILIQKLDESFMLKNELQNFIKSMNSVLQIPRGSHLESTL